MVIEASRLIQFESKCFCNTILKENIIESFFKIKKGDSDREIIANDYFRAERVYFFVLDFL